jgi:hypothetical protein
VPVREVTMFLRTTFFVLACVLWHCVAYAGPDCTLTESRKAGDLIVDWYELYVRPFRPLPAPASLSKEQVEALVEELTSFHRPAVLDPLFFEPLVEQISARYAGASGFRGIDAPAVEKYYKSGTGARYDFSLLCIDAKSMRSPDDAFAITLFGVNVDDCQHVGLRGLVYTETWVNGSAGGQCRPDRIYYRRMFIPVAAGTNTITFLCRKDMGGCAR